MVMCFVPDCKHYSERDSCRFFRFPCDEQLKIFWVINIRRQDRLPSSSSLVCSCHFQDGVKANGPTIFDRNEEMKLADVTPEIRKHYTTNLHQPALLNCDALPVISTIESVFVSPEEYTVNNQSLPDAASQKGMVKQEENSNSNLRDILLFVVKTYIGEKDYINAISLIDKAIDLPANTDNDVITLLELKTLQCKYQMYRL